MQLYSIWYIMCGVTFDFCWPFNNDIDRFYWNLRSMLLKLFTRVWLVFSIETNIFSTLSFGSIYVPLISSNFHLWIKDRVNKQDVLTFLKQNQVGIPFSLSMQIYSSLSLSLDVYIKKCLFYCQLFYILDNCVLSLF